jgi:hypothetical protein
MVFMSEIVLQSKIGQRAAERPRLVLVCDEDVMEQSICNAEYEGKIK